MQVGNCTSNMYYTPYKTNTNIKAISGFAINDDGKLEVKETDENWKGFANFVDYQEFHKAWMSQGVTKPFTFSINNTSNADTAETDKYVIRRTASGDIRISDKKTDEGFIWKYNENKVQVDSASGKKFLINDLGAGFFNMVTLDADLENALKEFVGIEEFEEKELEDFTVHQDNKTGIYYITSNGYEGQGGQIIMDDATKNKLDSLAERYLSQYPQMLKDKQEAWFYATFEVRGLAKRTNTGITMIGPNSVTHRDIDNKYDWTNTFEIQNWSTIKDLFDKNDGRFRFI